MRYLRSKSGSIMLNVSSIKDQNFRNNYNLSADYKRWVPTFRFRKSSWKNFVKSRAAKD